MLRTAVLNASQIFILISGVLCISSSHAQDLYFPPTSGSTWESVDPESLDWCTDKIPDLLDFLEENSTKAFIILKDGKIVLEEYFDDHNQNRFWYWASAGKSLTSFAVGMAEAEGLIDLEASTSSYLGDGWTSLSQEQEEKIKVIHQLTMTSGLDDAHGDVHCTDPDCLVYKADPGDRWAYHNAPYTLLDNVMEAATGSDINAFIQNRLKQPTGMKGLFIKLDYLNVYWSDARSMARFGLLVSNDGVWDDEIIMDNPTYIDNMRKPSQDINPAYGYLWWLNGSSHFMIPQLQIQFPGSATPSAPADMYSGLGKDGQYVNIVPSEGLVVVRMGEAPDNSLVPTVFLDDMWEHIMDVVCLSTSTNKTIDGDLTVFPNPVGDFLKFTAIDQEEVRVHSITGHNFILPVDDQQVDVRRLPSGTYYVQFVDENGYLRGEKFVKQE